LNYLRNHWTELTQFLRVPGAPLDNNAAERALKLMIRQRRNSLFFASAYSAGVASMLCSVIATAMNAGVNVVEYLVVLQQHGREVMENAHPWLPWNYQAHLIPPLSHAAPILGHRRPRGIAAPEQDLQLARREPGSGLLGAGPPAQPPRGQALGAQPKPLAVVAQNLQCVAGAVAKHIDRPVQGIVLQGAPA
jgi:hypothetical protein